MYAYLGSTDILLYDVFTVYISSLALLVYNLAQIKEKRGLLSEMSKAVLLRAQKGTPHGTERIIGILALIEIVLISLYQHGLVSPLNKLLGEILPTGVNYFGLIIAMPVLLPFLCWMIGVDPYKQIDLITPAYPLALFFMKLGCFCAGCCEGIPCSFGLYNMQSERVEFPVQLLEAAVALGIFFFLRSYRRKAAEGTLFPMYIILYCATRFFSEFLRADPGIIGFLKLYHILCLLGLISGIVQFVIVRKHRDRLDRLFEKSLPSLLAARKGQ